MEKTLRSLIQEKFDLDLRYEIELLSRRRDLVNEEKQEELIKLLQSKNIDNIVPLGPGTNRYAFKLDGFVIKVATDHDGKIDNLKEFKMAKRLYPYVTKTYEVSENGTILVAEYIQPFESFSEMLKYADKIREILDKLSAVYLIGDVGITPNNFANWGLRIGSLDPVCLDFAYVYEVSSKLFLCRYCEAHAMLVPNKDFTELHCSNPACGRKYLFEDIRAKIGNDIHRHEIGDLSLEGYKLIKSHTHTVLDENRSNYLVKMKKVEEEKAPQEEEIPYVDNFVMPQENIMGGNIMSNITEIAGGVGAASSKRNVISIQVNATLTNPQVVAPPQQENKSTTSPESAKLEKNSIYGETGTPIKTEVLQTGSVSKDEEKEAEPVKDTLAFSGTMSDKYDILSQAAPEIQATVVIPEAVVTPPVVEMNGKYQFPANIHERKVLENMISDVCNRMRHEMHLMDAFNTLKPGVTDKKMLAGQFYKSVQNAAFRTMVAFCGFSEHEETRQDNSGKYLVFDPPEDLYNPSYMETLIFLCEFTKFIAAHKNMTNEEQMKAYRAEHPDHPGIQREWLPIFERRMFNKMPIDAHCSKQVVDIIDQLYCIPAPVEPEPVPPTPPSDDGEEKSSPFTKDELREAAIACIATGELDDDVFDELDEDDDIEEFALQLVKAFGRKHYNIDLDCSNHDKIMMAKYVFNIKDESIEVLGFVSIKEFTFEFRANDTILLDISGDTVEEFCESIIRFDAEAVKEELMPIVTAMVDPSSTQYEMAGIFPDGTDLDENDEEVMTTHPLCINVYPDDEFDVIRMTSNDYFGDISIPFYAQLCNVRTEPMDTPTDPRNGMWDFLTCMVPDLMFRTQRPDYFLNLNNEELEEDQIKFVILRDEGKDGCVMAIYSLAGIYVCNDEGEMEANFDTELIQKLNRLISEDMSYGRISHLHRSLTMKQLINSEAYVLNDVFEGQLGTIDEDGSKAELTPEEQAALQIIMHGSSALPEDASPEDKAFADQVRQSAFNSLGVPTPEQIVAGAVEQKENDPEPAAEPEAEEEFTIGAPPQANPVEPQEPDKPVGIPIVRRQYNNN